MAILQVQEAMRTTEGVDEHTWAIVLAPDGGCWKVKYLLNGAWLAGGGGMADNLEDALGEIRALAELLKQDALTARLFLCPEGKIAD